jgi:hypothetical protein
MTASCRRKACRSIAASGCAACRTCRSRPGRGSAAAAPTSSFTAPWFHQHFGVGREGLRITAWHGPNNQRSRKPGLPDEQLMDHGAIDLGKGGSAIPFHQEDPAIHAEFEQELAREGVASRMNPEFYRRPPADGEEVMGDVM